MIGITTMLRRATRHLALCLILGLATTLGIAWGSAMIPANYGRASTLYALGPILSMGGRYTSSSEIERRDSFACTRLLAMQPRRTAVRPVRNPYTNANVESLVLNIAPPSPQALDVPAWRPLGVAAIRLDRPTDNRILNREWTLIETRGWPCRALLFEEHGARGARQVIVGGLAVPHWQNKELIGWRGYGVTLPYIPIWRGLLANTAIFAAAWSVLLYGVPLVQREIRRRKGHCVKCGYDRQGLDADARCPECGEASL